LLTEPQKLGSKRESAILALLSTRSVEEAARAVGVNPRTLYRLMKEPEFDPAYRAAKRAAFGNWSRPGRSWTRFRSTSGHPESLPTNAKSGGWQIDHFRFAGAFFFETAAFFLVAASPITTAEVFLPSLCA
jgi:Helix-turn-helix domain